MPDRQPLSLSPSPLSPAVFLDRDDTIIVDPPEGYISKAEQVELMPGAIQGLKQLARAGWPLVVVSNQSGIARGFYDTQGFFVTMDRLHFLLEKSGIRLLAAYYCPHHPDVTGPCNCRKPEPRLYQRAAADHGLDLARSWYVGNRFSDAIPARRFGGRGLVITPDAADAEARLARAAGIAVVPDLVAAAQVILS